MFGYSRVEAGITTRAGDGTSMHSKTTASGSSQTAGEVGKVSLYMSVIKSVLCFLIKIVGGNFKKFRVLDKVREIVS